MQCNLYVPTLRGNIMGMIISPRLSVSNTYKDAKDRSKSVRNSQNTHTTIFINIT